MAVTMNPVMTRQAAYFCGDARRRHGQRPDPDPHRQHVGRRTPGAEVTVVFIEEGTNIIWLHASCPDTLGVRRVG